MLRFKFRSSVVTSVGRLMPLLVASALVLSSAAAQADLGDQLFKLLPDDGTGGYQFGYSVGISGTIAIVGARFDDDTELYSGSAYLFDASKGQQIAKLLPIDSTENDQFGYSVAISGSTAIVGAYYDDDNGIGSGSAYLFDTTTGQQIAKLLPDDGAAADNWFGFSVAISGTTAIVGAYEDSDIPSSSGSAYLFDATTGRQIAKLLPEDGAVGDAFGSSVAISGTTAIIGARNDDDNDPFSGSAYLFDATTGSQIAKLLPDDGAAGDWFGYSVAISGPTAIVGAYRDDDDGKSSGSAYLFETTTGLQVAKLLADDGAGQDLFGISVAISGTTAIVGAMWDDAHGSHSGSAYLFDVTTAQQIAKLLPNEGAPDDWFGYRVAIDGAAALVGVRYDDDNGGNSGSAYLFEAGSASACPWDIDGSGAVGAFDLALLLGFWGPNPGHPADLDGDGEIGSFDLALLLGNWGPCG